jgi:hypothetical protein
MNMSLGLLALVGVTMCAATLQGADETSNARDKIRKAEHFIETAVFDGLTKDHLPRALAKSLLETKDNWVEKCEICDASKHGFERYLQAASGGTSGLARDMETRLQSDHNSVRLFALNQLIQKYLTTQLKEPERQWLMEAMMTMKKHTDELKPPMGFCAVCEGACLLDPPSVVTEIVIEFKNRSYGEPRQCFVRVIKDGASILERASLSIGRLLKGEAVRYSYKPFRPTLSVGGTYQVVINGEDGQPGPGGGVWTVEIFDGKGRKHSLIDQREAPLKSQLIEIAAGNK